MILIPYLIDLQKAAQAKHILIFIIKFMYKPIPSKIKPPHKKSEYAKQEISRKKMNMVQRQE